MLSDKYKLSIKGIKTLMVVTKQELENRAAKFTLLKMIAVSQS
jgi:hypothetical protein